MLDVPRELVLYVARLLRAERRRRGTRKGARLLSCWKQAMFVLVWFRKKDDIELLRAGFGPIPGDRLPPPRGEEAEPKPALTSCFACSVACDDAHVTTSHGQAHDAGSRRAQLSATHFHRRPWGCPS
jgi:hypothetical protein